MSYVWRPRKSITGANESNTEWNICTAHLDATEHPSNVMQLHLRTEYCDGGVPTETRITGYGTSRCNATRFNCGAPNTWGNPEDSNNGHCSVAPPYEQPGDSVCEANCAPEPERCSPEDDHKSCDSCPGNPVCVAGSGGSAPLGQGALFEVLPVFPLDSRGGFPAEFSVILTGQSGYHSTNIGGPMGPRTMHSFAPALDYEEGTPPTFKVCTEKGALLPFVEETPGFWRAKDDRVATLQVFTASGCTGTAVATLGDGTRYTFGEAGPAPCNGIAHAEGRIQRIDRRDGNYLVFLPDAEGFIGSVTDRLGATVQLLHLTEGTLEKVVSPSGDTFRFWYDGTLTEVWHEGDTGPLWQLSWGSDANNKWLTEVRDAKAQREHSWTYINDGTRSRVLTEDAPGSNPNARLTFSYDTTNAVTSVSFLDADGVPRTNSFAYAAGDRARVTTKTIEGACPGCGRSKSIDYWPTKPWPRRVMDANGFITVYEDLNVPGVRSAAYDDGGNPLVIYDGCTGTLISPICGSERRRSFTYIAGTRVVATSTKVSVGGGVVARTRMFDGSSTRVLLDSTEGHTTSALDGTLDAALTKRTTKYTYGGGAGGVELTSIEGPYLDTGSPPTSSDARTDFEWYTDTTDYCGGPTNPNNLNRLKVSKRWVTATRYIETRYCSYTAAGLVGQVWTLGGGTDLFTYNWRGQVTVRTHAGSAGGNTNFSYDLSGNLTEILEPTVDGKRVGTRFTYDDADRLIQIDKGCHDGSTFWAIRSVRYTHDNWGNRTLTEYSSGGVIEVTESAEFDAFGRLEKIARPGSSATNQTIFAYDNENNLTMVGDKQGDDVFYGSGPPFVAAYDKLGKITRVKEEICDHPLDPNTSCTPSDHIVEYDYDVGMNLTEVRVPDAVRGGTMTTHYVTDDFGSVINVNGPDDGGDAFYRFDGAGRLAESQDNRQLDGGYSMQYFYDRLGRMTEKKSSNGALSIKYCYDGYNVFCGGSDASADPGYMTAVNDQVYSWRFDYDTKGRLLTEMSSSTVTVRQYSYAADGRVLWERQPNGLYMKYTYNNDGTVGIVFWSPDAVSAGSIVITGTTWGAQSELRSTVFPVSGSAIALQLDWNAFTSGSNYQSGRLASITLKQISNGTVLERLTYGYADDGTVKETSRLGTYGEGLGTIRHDSLGRITKDLDTGSSAWGVQAFTYDQGGNRYTRDPNPPGGALSYSYPSNTSNRLTGAESLAYGFDDSGSAYARVPGVGGIGYDQLGRVSSVTTGSGTTSFTRDFRNHRISKTGVGGAGSYYYNDAGDMIQWTGPSSVVQCSSRPVQYKTVVPYENYIHVGGRRLAMVKSQGETACGTPSGPIVTVTVLNRYLYIGDKMDMPRAIYRNTNTKVWTANFDAFGNPIAGGVNENPAGAGTFTNSHRLPGQFALATAEGGPTTTAGGLHENWNRIYDSVIGRYLQPDPVKGSIMSPQTLNPYPYVASRPLRSTDPDGRIIVDDRTGQCDGCMDKYWESNWKAGWELAQVAAYNENCAAYFRRYGGADVHSLLANGTPPHAILGGPYPNPSPNSFRMADYRPIRNTVRIGCSALGRSPKFIAATLLHELAHYADDATGIGHGESPEPDGSDPWAGGFGAEEACFGGVVPWDG